ncbi:MAG TPA: hypothetical protein VIC26_08625, partial [Marinagarivorans sp.]
MPHPLITRYLPVYKAAITAIALCHLAIFSPIAKAAPLPERINFQHPLKNKDIVLGEAASIFQDSFGFMWFGGANAIIRYDGYEFKSIPLTVYTDQ